jgi:hypothetical protein
VLFVDGCGHSEGTAFLQNIRDYLPSDSSSEDLTACVTVMWKGAKILINMPTGIIVAPSSTVSH